MGEVVLLSMLATVALGLIWKLGHRAYRELIRRRQAARVRRVLAGDLAVAHANQVDPSRFNGAYSDAISLDWHRRTA